jgi:hypothetical protein
MRQIIIPVAIGVAAALGWLVMWTFALRVFDIPFLVRTSEQRATRRQLIVRMGKLRYTLIFGVCGYGFAMGLGNAIAGVVAHDSLGWAGAAIKLVLWAGLFGWWHGVTTWNTSFRGEVPFPPPCPPQT